ncbi:Golgi-associated RAB2 interactor protein 6-like [Hipposideros larvatus]
MLARLSARSSPMLHLFGNSSGKLQRQLRKGEFAMFKHMPVFESDFIQISKRGYMVDVHKSVQMVTVGITFSSPGLPIPDVMLLARPAGSHAVHARCDRDNNGRGLKSAKSLELTRLLPLKFVKLSIFSHEKKQLRLKLATGRSFYLQLCPPADAKEDVFAQWEDLVFLLRPPVEAYSGMQAERAYDMMDLPVLEAEDKRSPEAMEVHGKGQQNQVSRTRSLPMDTEGSGATSPADTTGEGLHTLASGTYCMLRKTESVMKLAPVGPEQGAEPRAAVTPLGSRSVEAGGDMSSTCGTATSEGPGAGPSVSALPRQDNTGEQGGGRRASQPQDEALRKRKKKDTFTRRPSHSGRKREDKSVLRSHGTTRGHQREKGLTSPSNSQMGSRLSQKPRSLSKTIPGGAP